MDNSIEYDPQAQVMTTPVVYLSLDPAILASAPDVQYVVISFEKIDSIVDTIAITHDEGLIMVGNLLQCLASQGSIASQCLLEMLSELEAGEGDEDQDEQEEDEDEFSEYDGDLDNEDPEGDSNEEAHESD